MSAPVRVAALLDAARRHLAWQHAAVWATHASLAAAGCVIVTAAWAAFSGKMPEHRLAWAIPVAALLAALPPLFRPPTRARAAAVLDALAGSHDRLSTALYLADATAPTERAALAECEEFASRCDTRALLRASFLPRFGALGAAGAAYAALCLFAYFSQPARLPEPPALRELADQAEALRKLAAALAAERSPAMREAAEAVREAAARIKPTVTDRADVAEARKRALAEWAALQAALGKMGAKGASADELAALGQALRERASTAMAADALAEAGEEAAAEAMEQVVRAASRDEIARANMTMAEAAAQIPQESAGRLAEAMRRAGEAGETGAAEAMARVAQTLRDGASQRGGDQGQGKGRSQVDRDALQKLLSALQDIKDGKGEGRESSDAGDREQTGEGRQGQGVAMKGFGEGEAGLVSETGAPSGRPGGEMDTGTTESPFGREQTESFSGATPLHAQGILGEGESLSELISAAGADETARARLRVILEAARGRAESSVSEERIPPGARDVVRRYFESLRTE